jgi:hypothetical protein
MGFRRRYSYIPDPPKVHDLMKPLDEAKKELARTQLQLTQIRAILKNSPAQLKWGTTPQVARSFRYQLNTYRRWLAFRQQFLKTERQMEDLISKFRFNCHDPHGHHHLPRRTGDSGTAYITGSAFETGLPTPEQHALVWKVHAEWYQLCLEVDIFHEQTKELLTLPDYQQLKPLMPINGRAAYSVLIACRQGKIDSNLPAQKNLFGWHGNYTEKAQPNLRKVARAIRSRELEKRGPAPSFKTGCKILDSYTIAHLEPFQWKPAEVSSRKSYIISRYSNTIFLRTFTGRTDSCTASMLKWLNAADLHDLDVRHRIAFKVMKIESPGTVNTGEGEASGEPPVVIPPRCENNVLTALTGSVEHLYGDDYYAPAIYTNIREKGDYPFRVKESHTVYGYVLFRRGWPDMVHCTEAEFAAALKDRAHIGILDRASMGYFQRLRDEAEKKLTTKQRTARMLRQLRSIFVPVARTDSYNSSNCRPGTEAFVQQLKQFSTNPAVMDDTEASISGPELARCWRKAKYIQADRLANVIRTLLSKQATQISLAFDAAAALFPVADSQVEDLPAKELPTELPITQDEFPLETNQSQDTEVEHDTRQATIEREEILEPAAIDAAEADTQTAGSPALAASVDPYNGTLVSCEHTHSG